MSSEAISPERIDELEQALGRVPAVTAVRTVLGLSGEIAEVHIVSTDGRSPKLLVRDIQSVAKAMFDLEIDYRKVSVVQMASQRDEAPKPAAPDPAPQETLRLVHDARLATVEPSVARVVISQSGPLSEVEVHLTASGEEAVATLRGPSSHVSALAAQAALGARGTLGKTDAAVVAGVEETVVGGRRVVVVAVIVATAAGEVFATACATVTGSAAEAAAAAVLQAVAGPAVG